MKPLLIFFAMFAFVALAADFQTFSPDRFTAEVLMPDGGRPDNLLQNFDGKQNTFSMFERLAGAEIKLSFHKPMKIKYLAIVQVGWDNWAHPKTIELLINEKDVKIINLQNQPGNANLASTGMVQLCEINSDVSTLRIKVAAIYSQGGIGWGSVGEIGFATEDKSATLRAQTENLKNTDSASQPTLPALSDTEQRKIKIKPWPLDTINVSGTAERSAKNLLNAFKSGGEALFDPLVASHLDIEFKSPQEIKLLGIQQGSWGNWSHIKELAVSVDGGAPRLFTFSASPLTQAVELNVTARKLSLYVKSVYAGTGIMPWGGFSLIGEAEFESIRFSSASQPFPMTATALEFEFEAKRSISVPVTAYVTSSKLPYVTGTPLELKPGMNRIRIPLSRFKEPKPYGIDWRACHIHTLEFGAASNAADPGFLLKKVLPVIPENAPADPWYDLEKFDPPTSVFEGKSWTEGMSYSSSGRFGNSTYNGLLDDVVGDLWFHAYTGGPRDQLRRQKFDLWITGIEHEQNTLDSAKPWIINGLNVSNSDDIRNSWTHMIRKMRLARGTELTWLVSSLVPGFLADCNRAFSISSRGGGNIPKRSGAPNEDENRFFQDAERNDKTAQIGPTMVVTASQVFDGNGSVEMGNLTEPWLVAIWGGINQSTFWGDKAVAVLFTLDKGEVKWDSSGISLPAGRVGISSSFHGLLQPGWHVEALRKRATLLTGMLRNYPLECREFYRIENNQVLIRNEFSYEKWGNVAFQAPDYAPLPPMFVWGALYCNWGKLPIDRTRLIDTPTGPYTWNPGNSTSYLLPLPVNRHAAFPANPDFRELNDELMQKFLTLAEPKPEDFHMIGNAWTTSYRPLRVGASILGYSYSDAAVRQRLLDLLRVSARNGFRDFGWIPRRELFSKRSYLASLWVDDKVSPAMFGDINSGMGASCYALYMYSKYSGDWSLARKLWPRVLDVIRFAEVVNDWAIPMTSAREGILFGGIDMDTIGFLGVTAAERMAQQVGSSADCDRLAYLRAKIAPATALRFTFQHYLDPAGRFPQLWVNGFSESGPNLEWATAENGVGLDHVAMLFCWQGQQPEMYQFLLQLPGAKFMTKFQKELMDQQFTGKDFSGWRKMPFNYTRTAAHLAMRAWLPGWERSELERDYQFWISRSQNEKNLFNSGFFGIYQGSVDRVFLSAWEPASLGGLSYDREKRQLTAELTSEQAFRLEGFSPTPVAGVMVDGKEISLPEIIYDGGYFSLTMPPCRRNAVVIFER